MHRLDRKTLDVNLRLRLRKALIDNKFGLRSKLISEKDAAFDAVVTAIIDEIDCESACVVQASSVPYHMGSHPGRFGVDEPWPAPLEIEMFARTPSCASDDQIVLKRMTMTELDQALKCCPTFDPVGSDHEA